MLLTLVLSALLARGDTTPPTAAIADSVRIPIPAVDTTALQDTVRRRPRAIEYSDWYSRRLTIHRIGSYTMLPLFATQYVLGNQLLHGASDHSSTAGAHVAVAVGVGALFTVNTVTGLWNLWDSRQDPAGRTRRIVHSLLMLGADAGFVWTGAIGDDAKRSTANARHHRDVALGSMALSTVGAAMMWFWK